MGAKDDLHEPLRRPLPLDRRIARVAAAQYARIGDAQLLGLGASRAEIRGRLRRGTLVPCLPGVYAVGCVVRSHEARLMQTQLWAAPQGALCHRAAGGVWGVMPPDHDGPVDVMFPGGSRRPPDGIRCHRARDRAAMDVVERHGWRVTGLARTLLDLAQVCPDHEPVWAVRAAMDRFGLTADMVQRAVARTRTHPGSRRLRAVVRDEVPPVRSEFERRFLVFVRRSGLPEPEVNQRMVVEGRPRELDFFWPRFGVGVETNGFRWHSGRERFEADQERAAAFEASGLSVLPLTWRQFHERPAVVARRLEALLSARGWSGRQGRSP